VKGRQKEHERNPLKFLHDKVKAHEDELLYWMTYAWEKCDLLGLEDQKKILDGMVEEMDFENSRPKIKKLF